MPDAVAVLPPLLLLVDPFALRNSSRSLGRRGMKDRLWYSVPCTVMPTGNARKRKGCHAVYSVPTYYKVRISTTVLYLILQYVRYVKVWVCVQRVECVHTGDRVARS